LATTNSAAVIGGDLTGVVKEDEILSASGQLTIDDVDGEREFVPVDTFSGNGHFTLTKDGAWTYEIKKDDSMPSWWHDTDEFWAVAKDGTHEVVTIAVSGTNDAPVLGSGRGSTNQDQTLTMMLSATDPDGDILGFSSPDGAKHGRVGFSGTVLFYTPDPYFYGYDGFTLVVSDGHGGTATGYFQVSVDNDFEAPFGTDKSVTIAEDTSHTVMVDDFGFSDYKDAGPEINHFDAAIISAVSGDGELWFGNAVLDLSNGAVRISKADIEAGKLVWKTDANTAGEAHITFNVKDDGDEEVFDNNTSKDANTLTINVAAVNDAPSFHAGADQTVTEDSGSHMVANWATLISAGPSNESEQTLSFDVSNDNAALFEEGPSISADGTLTYKLAADTFGSATVTVVLQDSGSGQGDNDNTSAPVTFTITATGSADAPKLTGLNADAEVSAGASLALQIGDTHFADPDGDDLTYAITVNGAAMPAWMTFNTATGAFKVTPGAENVGDYQITVTASDGGLTASDTFDLTVTHPATSGDDIRLSSSRIAENSAAGTRIGALSGLDGAGDDFASFALGSNPGKMFRIVDGDLVVNKNARFDFEARSSYAVEILATDDDELTVQKTFTITVKDVREDPRGTKGNDDLHGDAKNNILDGGRGNDKLTGGDGSDTFVFSRGYGKDVITDFDFKGADHDTLDLRKLVGVDSFKDLMARHIEKSGADVIITGDHGDQVTLSHFKIGNLAAADFLF
jgi:VCBS repeat-containing protein